MISTLEPTKFSIKGIVNVHAARSVKCHHTVKQEYWHGMAVLHWRMREHISGRRLLWVQLWWTRQNDSSELIGHI